MNNQVLSTEAAVPQAEPTRNERTFLPNVDILESAEELQVVMDLPGASPEGVDITFEKGTLTVHAKVTERRAETAPYLLREYGVGDFHRSFQVDEKIDATKIAAEYVAGVLTLHLPKAQAAKTRKIEVVAK
ncbi:MAG: Hsp20/alpha crystallin family protein [Planctomycetota bacterium]